MTGTMRLGRRRELFLNRSKGYVDWWLILCMVALIVIGIVAVSNATADPYAQVEGEGLLAQLSRLMSRSARLQMIWVGVGTVALMLVMFLLDYRVYGEFWVLIYIVANLLLAAMLLLPKVRGISAFLTWGQERTFQPSELCKVAIILTLAKHMSLQEGRIESLKQFLIYFLHFAIPFALVILQDDYGSAFVFAAIFIGMLFMAGMSWKLFLGAGVAAAAACIGVWPFLSEFRKNRILDFLDPERDISGSGLQVYYSKIAVGSGEMTGKGILQEGAISQLDFVPEKHTDFIFAVTAESVGFLGCLVILLLYLVLLLRLFYLAYRVKDKFGSCIIAGVGSMLLFHILENIGMTIGIMPVTGIPLPFLSYGGSNLLANMAAMGLVLNVVRNQQRSIF